MNKAYAVLTFCLSVFLAPISRGESPAKTEQALKAAQVKLDCCYKQASEFLLKIGRKDSLSQLEESQKAWEKYRDLAATFEVGDVTRDHNVGKEFYAAILLHLTNERIETLQRAFNHELCNPSDIRIRNGSDVDFKNVTVGGRNYGDIKRGEATSYQHWGTAYGYSSVSLIVDSKPLGIQPIDYVGEEPLGEGKFTYVLTIEKGQLEIRAVRDTE